MGNLIAQETPAPYARAKKQRRSGIFTPKRKWTVDEFIEEYSKLPDAHRYELQDGEVLMSPEATPFHGNLQMLLGALLFDYVAFYPGVEVFGPTNVAFSDDTTRGPDITVKVPGDGSVVKETKLEGSPGLLIEIVSPSKPNYDLVDKRNLYCSKQVPEIWFIDSVKRIGLFLTLEKGLYREQRMSTGIYRSTVLPELLLDIDALFDLDVVRLKKSSGLTIRRKKVKNKGWVLP